MASAVGRQPGLCYRFLIQTHFNSPAFPHQSVSLGYLTTHGSLAPYANMRLWCRLFWRLWWPSMYHDDISLRDDDWVVMLTSYGYERHAITRADCIDPDFHPPLLSHSCLRHVAFSASISQSHLSDVTLYTRKNSSWMGKCKTEPVHDWSVHPLTLIPGSWFILCSNLRQYSKPGK